MPFCASVPKRSVCNPCARADVARMKHDVSSVCPSDGLLRDRHGEVVLAHHFAVRSVNRVVFIQIHPLA